MALQQSSITVGLPVYNAMPFLPEAIESLLHQTVSDFNILVIVDGADDRSLQYLETVLDDRLRVLTQPNRGLTATLNRILHETRIGWLIRQDADDISYPTHLSGREPLSLADVSPMLEANISANRLEAKQQLRFLNMHLAAKRYGNALTALARSALASPSYFIQRMIDELFPLKSIANRISPNLLYRRKEVFWP